MRLKPWHVAAAAIAAALLVEWARRKVGAETPSLQTGAPTTGGRAPRSPVVGEVIEQAREITRKAAAT